MFIKSVIFVSALSATGFALLGLQFTQNPTDSVIGKLVYVKPCDTPITYRLDRVDPEFKIDKNQAKKDAQKAAAIWGSAYGKDIFVEKPDGMLAVSFVYDERQQLRTKLDEQEGTLDTEKLSLDIKIANYETKVADYERRAAQLNNEIESWNKKGGAPKDIYNRLVNDVKALNSRAVALNDEGQKLNKESEGLGKTVESLNNTVTTYNSLLNTKPEEGLYDPNDQTITIFIVGSPDELVSTITHEFGHALGIDHVTNKDAIMYSYANKNLKLAPEDLVELDKVCQTQNRVKVVWENLRKVSNRLLF